MLGTGAFAAVYLADDLQMGRPVAVKIVHHSVDFEDRVLREAQAAAKLSHHNIVTVYEMVREADRTLLISEYVEGKTLRATLSGWFAGRRGDGGDRDAVM